MVEGLREPDGVIAPRTVPLAIPAWTIAPALASGSTGRDAREFDTAVRTA